MGWETIRWTMARLLKGLSPEPFRAPTAQEPWAVLVYLPIHGWSTFFNGFHVGVNIPWILWEPFQFISFIFPGFPFCWLFVYLMFFLLFEGPFSQPSFGVCRYLQYSTKIDCNTPLEHTPGNPLFANYERNSSYSLLGKGCSGCVPKVW